MSLRASFWTSASGVWPRTGASFSAALTGSLTRYGVALTSAAGSETASGLPLRSTIEPRAAGSLALETCWEVAALRERPGPDAAEPERRGAPASDEEDEEGGEEEADAALDAAPRSLASLAGDGRAARGRDGPAGCGLGLRAGAGLRQVRCGLGRGGRVWGGCGRRRGRRGAVVVTGAWVVRLGRRRGRRRRRRSRPGAWAVVVACGAAVGCCVAAAATGAAVAAVAAVRRPGGARRVLRRLRRADRLRRGARVRPCARRGSSRSPPRGWTMPSAPAASAMRSPESSFEISARSDGVLAARASRPLVIARLMPAFRRSIETWMKTMPMSADGDERDPHAAAEQAVEEPRVGDAARRSGRGAARAAA